MCRKGECLSCEYEGASRSRNIESVIASNGIEGDEYKTEERGEEFSLCVAAIC